MIAKKSALAAVYHAYPALSRGKVRHRGRQVDENESPYYI
ncbi:hypothetical protein HMPREF9420_1750 [Segatella salivae DSM 15606]|uniref:Uncharacterized protein n=1 Tax=Segatella salivae DSM 15606 TaxID=888832 RepID=E6MQI2_9BACT|nr:hypothetical protein HMPREF9420_1750 [Segatella salivae DSM 15606]